MRKRWRARSSGGRLTSSEWSACALSSPEAAAGRLAYKETDGVDPDWSIWNAGHLLENGVEKLLDARLLKSDLIYLLVLADKQHMSEAPGAHWENYYADFFVSRYLK